MTNEEPRATDDDTQLDDTQLSDPAGDDTEGHSLMIDPTTARQLSRAKEQDIDRAARERQRQKDARGR